MRTGESPTSAFAVYGNSGEVADPLTQPGQSIEEGGFSAVGVADEGDFEGLIHGINLTWTCSASLRRRAILFPSTSKAMGPPKGAVSLRTKWSPMSKPYFIIASSNAWSWMAKTCPDCPLRRVDSFFGSMLSTVVGKDKKKQFAEAYQSCGSRLSGSLTRSQDSAHSCFQFQLLSITQQLKRTYSIDFQTIETKIGKGRDKVGTFFSAF